LPGALGHRAGGGGVGFADELEVAGEFGFGDVVEVGHPAVAILRGGLVFDEGGEVGVEPPEGLVARGGVGFCPFEGGEGFAAAAFAHQQGDDPFGPARVGAEAGFEAAEGGDGEVDLASPFGELFEGFEHFGGGLVAGAGLQEGEGLLDAAEALVGGDDGSEAGWVGVWRRASHSRAATRASSSVRPGARRSTASQASRRPSRRASTSHWSRATRGWPCHSATLARRSRQARSSGRWRTADSATR
jgi:hypothetical protein